ncbi:thioredoxin family protein [Halobaculum marinum]|uniref:Thioredoxin family protein n=1 Tax=Halobaculum marinum TaxID=3031996 RepID=A0ABD5WRE5_9EURY|nr:thioredoxin family protein [Halobaculum sp. DT55]
MSATLSTMEPDAEFDADGNADVVAALGADSLTYKVWGGDWCPDCTGQLPQFAAALDAAGVSGDRVEQFPVEKVDGEKQGPGMDEYGVTHIPTVIVFDDGEEVARFVESADTDIATYLARELGAD